MFPGSALSSALDVLDNPSLAVAARRSSLPADIGRLLALLPGHADRLHPAAAQAGVEPDHLLAAARHYVREVLLHPDADDARMLGLGPNSRPEDLKRHYRALQAWLHPDRGSGQESDAALSARVNAAWSRLRADSQAASPDAGLTQFRPRWRKVELDESRRPARSWPGVLAGAMALGFLAWIVWPDPASVKRKAGNSPSAATASLPTVVPEDGVEPEDDAGSRATAATAQRALPAEDSPTSAFPSPEAVAMASTMASPPLPSAPAVAYREVSTAEIASALPPTLHAATVEPAAFVLSASPVRVPNPAVVESQPARLVVEAPEAPAQGLAQAEPSVAPVAPAANRAMPAGSLEYAVETEADAGRAQGARILADALFDYLLQPGRAAPPIWHSGIALDQADRVRQILGATGKAPRARVLREQATWQSTPGQADLRVPVETAGPGSDRRTLQARLQWKQDSWWVSQVALEEVR